MVALSPLAALIGAYQQVSAVAEQLDDAAIMLPSRCAGWAVGDVLYHQLLDARRALVTLASPSGAPADCDDISYWRPFSSGGEFRPGSAGAARHARQVRTISSAYSPDQLASEWVQTADAACRAALDCPHERVATQGHVLRTADFIATLAVEAAVHYLDLTVGLPTAQAPEPESLGLVRRVITGLAGSPLAVGWDDITLALKGTGRLPLSDAERSGMGTAADRFPLFG